LSPVDDFNGDGIDYLLIGALGALLEGGGGVMDTNRFLHIVELLALPLIQVEVWEILKSIK